VTDTAGSRLVASTTRGTTTMGATTTITTRSAIRMVMIGAISELTRRPIAPMIRRSRAVEPSKVRPGTPRRTTGARVCARLGADATDD